MITCLLIDDDPDDHDFFRTALNRIHPGIHCHVADNGLEGLNLLTALKDRPDVIFLDLNMPILGGLEFLDEIKKTDLNDIPVVIYSTSDERYFKQKAIERGARAYLTKAYTMKELVSGISDKLKGLDLL